MAHYLNSITETIGRTPLVLLGRYDAACGTGVNIFAKVESFNPGGSVKDRVALNMINKAEEAGLLRPGGTIIEPTSGNTGVGLALVGTTRGYKVILTMPETMSMERRKLLAALGATIVLTPGKEGMKGAIAEAERLRDATPELSYPASLKTPPIRRPTMPQPPPRYGKHLMEKWTVSWPGWAQEAPSAA